MGRAAPLPQRHPAVVRAAVLAALARVYPERAEDPAWLALEAEWEMRDVRFDLRGVILWQVMRLGARLRECLSEAQNHRCCRCGERFGEPGAAKALAPCIVHAVLPSEGGSDHPDNLVLVHWGCCAGRSRGAWECLAEEFSDVAPIFR